MFKRLIEIDKKSSHSVMLLGPRGTGKTYWLKYLLPNALYFDLLDVSLYQALLAKPGLLGERIPTDYTGWVIVDEIQKVPILLNEVHRLIEGRHLRFILTGSSARSLRRKGVNLLAGRALTKQVYPLTTCELGDQFSLETALRYGGLPSVYTYENRKDYLASYVKTYLREEVLQESLTRNLNLFTRFLEAASFSQGEIVSYTKIAQETASNRHTVTNYFELLEDLLLAYRLPVFKKRTKRRLLSHPKFYFFDVGIYRVLRPKGLLDSTDELEGAALETLFLQEAMALNSYLDWGYNFYYWRTHSQLEVDFVLYGDQGFHAFEIKRKSTLTANDFKGLRAFAADYPMATCYMFYGGNECYRSHNIQVVPFETGLRSLKAYLGDVLE